MSREHASTARRTFVSYIDKSREFYAAHGYDKPYQWATHDDVPFAPLSSGALAALRVGVVTTTFPVGAPMPKQVMAIPTSPTPEAMFTADLSWDKDATHTNDVGSFLPLNALHAAVERGTIGSVAPRTFCVPTQYSQRQTREDAVAIESWCREDDVDVVVLVPL